MKKILAAVKVWEQGDYLTLGEKLGDGVTWLVSMVAVWFVSRHYHFGFVSTMLLLGIVPFVISEVYCFMAVRDRMKKKGIAALDTNFFRL